MWSNLVMQNIVNWSSLNYTMHQSIKTPTPWVPGKGRGFYIDPSQKASISLPPEVRVQIKCPYPCGKKDENIKSFKKKRHVLKDIRANCFCASLLRTAACANSHATSCIKRAGQELKWTMIGQIAIATALLGFNDLGRSVTPIFFLETDFIYNYLHCSKMNKKSMWEVIKNSRFLSMGHEILPSCGCKVRETMVSKIMRTYSLRNLTCWLNSLNRST